MSSPRISQPRRSPELARAYEHCRAVAKREAKNFYYSFVALPKPKSDAMCAIYAFMRKADDLADDESLTLDQRREAMAAWTAAWRLSRTEASSDPVFLAVLDTQYAFNISDDLLEQLVAGTTMDLEESLSGVETVLVDGVPLQVYRTFDDLYRYCYLVASVVGLTCIKIFGYTDPRAELLAERTGVAFQLTNILRDIREDAERGRVYLPLDEQAACNVDLSLLVAKATMPWPHPIDGPTLELLKHDPAVARLLQKEIERARELYRSADELIPLLDKDSRPAMRVLATIYRELLEIIAKEPHVVLLKRFSVPTSRKLTILIQGMASSFLARLGS